MKFCEFTGPSGRKVWIAPSWVIKIADNIGDFHGNVRTEIHHSGGVQGVIEPMDEVVKDLEAAS